MRERSPLDAALIETRQAFADLILVLGAIDGLRTRADRLLPLLLTELQALRPVLGRVIALLEEDQEEGSR